MMHIHMQRLATDGDDVRSWEHTDKRSSRESVGPAQTDSHAKGNETPPDNEEVTAFDEPHGHRAS